MVEIMQYQAFQNNYKTTYYSLWARNISNTISNPNLTQGHMRRCHKDENVTKTYRYRQVKTQT